MTTTKKSKHTQTFAYRAPAALRVQVVGSFTEWQKAPLNLHKGADGVWRNSLLLEPGTYQYRFVVDGQWQEEPACTLRLPNPFESEGVVRHAG